MRIETFELERTQSIWENTVAFNLTESGLHPFTMRELLTRDEIETLLDLPLGYGHTEGEPALRAAIADLHPEAGPENVLVTTGSSEANMLAVLAFLDAGDEAIVVTPNFMQLAGLARALGTHVHQVPLRRSGDGWSLDLDELAGAITPATRLISVCNPNNPTGALLTADETKGLAELADRHGVAVHADEVYRGAEISGQESGTLFGRAGNVIAVGGMAKAMALAGLRIGWLVASEAVIEKAMQRQDYTTIGSNVLGQRLALMALSPERRSRIFARNRDLVRRNLAEMTRWVESHAGIVDWVPPEAGAMAFLRYDLPIGSDEFSRRLRESQGVFVVAGNWFGMEGYLRLSLGIEPAHLAEALGRIDAFLLANFGAKAA